jgi:anhydro-N-acetylmuramic acid kinase
VPRYVGVMSGTSADGIDAALVRAEGAAGRVSVKLEEFYSQAYPVQVRELVLKVGAGVETTTGEISQLNFLLGELFARAVLGLLKKTRVAARSVRAIGSHGQTVFHQGAREGFPAKRPVARIASTLQLGEPAVIAARTGIVTVGDFRPADMAEGGQGAPLVPFVDYSLFRDARRGRVALNIGGIANATIIPAGARADEVVAFDTGPGNMVIDGLAQRFTRGRMRFDRDAAMGRSGKLNEGLLDRLLKDPYFRKAPPKSAGREQFGAAYIEKIVAYGRARRLRGADVVHTATMLTAVTIANAITRFAPKRARLEDLIVSGGGSQNPLVMAQLAALLPKMSVKVSDDYGLPSQAKEAVAFAVLAHETMERWTNNLPSATGARRAVILGKVNYPAGAARK